LAGFGLSESVTEPELEELLFDCPTMFHIAEAGNWAIDPHTYGLPVAPLCSTCGVAGADRDGFHSALRAQSVYLDHARYGPIVGRDNQPMGDPLQDGLSPKDW
jgi:hypothetical protein